MEKISYHHSLINEYKILCLCASKHFSPESIDTCLKIIVQNNINWDLLITIGYTHKLLPLLYLNLKKIHKHIPKNVLCKLEKYYLKNTKKNLLMFGELLRILTLFESSNILAVPYKGPILAIQAYGGINFRDFGDLDIFIFKEDLFAVNELLISHGYEPQFNINSKNGKKYVSSQRELKFFNISKNVTVEIHWKFSGVFSSFPEYTEYILMEDKKKIEIQKKSVITLSNENLLLILSLHNASHHWSRLVWLNDVSELIYNCNINWHCVLQKADLIGMKRILYITLCLASDVFDLNIPKSLLEEISKDQTLNNLLPVLKENLFKKNKGGLSWEFFISFQIREDLKYGIKDCLKGLINPSFYEFNNLPLPNFLYPLYYFYRPYNLLKRYKLFKSKD